MASKTKSKKPAAKAKKKLDGKKLAANRKPRDSVAQFIKDELNAGKTDVAKILERAKADFPKASPTPGYVRFIAKQIGKGKQVESTRGKGEKKEKPAKAKPKAKTTSSKKTPAASEPAPKNESPDPAS